MNFFLNEEQKLLIFALNVKRVPRSPTLFTWERLNFYCCCSLCLSLMFVIIYWWCLVVLQLLLFTRIEELNKTKTFTVIFLLNWTCDVILGCYFIYSICLVGRIFMVVQIGFCCCCCIYTFAWQKNFFHRFVLAVAFVYIFRKCM